MYTMTSDFIDVLSYAYTHREKSGRTEAGMVISGPVATTKSF